MKEIHDGKWYSWIVSVGVLLRFLALIAAQPGFLGIDCGSKTNHTDRNNITWVNDTNYIHVGKTGDIEDTSQQAYGSVLHNLRFFPKPLNKSCYQLPVAPSVPYLLRPWFAIGNYSGFQQLPISFRYSIETLGSLAFRNITITDKSPVYREEFFVSSGSVLYVCLIRTSETDDPFINAIELRTLRDGMYGQAKPRRMLSSHSTINANSTTGGSDKHTPVLTNKKVGVPLKVTLSGIVIIALPVIAGIVLYVRRKKYVAGETNGVEKEQKRHLEVPSNERTDPTIIMPNPTKSCSFTLDEMTAATQKFSGTIGKGGFGSVYFGKLPEGRDIAVKVLSLLCKQGVCQFLNEIDILSTVHHKNLVSLLGYCNESKKLMLLYEYMSGGSLKDRLYGESELNWKSRIKIALDAALGLEYMHAVCTPKIIHRDIKTANILLDSNLNAKLGDFGLSRIWIDGEVSHVTTLVKGTAGYLDPEYFSTEKLTEKSDVYSFGVVLLEIICGRPPIDVTQSADKRSITRWAAPLIEMDAISGNIEEIIDKRLGGNYNMESVTRVAKVAYRCVKAEPSSRPNVREVVAELTEAIKLEDNDSFPASEHISIETEDLQNSSVSLSSSSG